MKVILKNTKTEVVAIKKQLIAEKVLATASDFGSAGSSNFALPKSYGAGRYMVVLKYTDKLTWKPRIEYVEAYAGNGGNQLEYFFRKTVDFEKKETFPISNIVNVSGTWDRVFFTIGAPNEDWYGKLKFEVYKVTDV